MSVNANKIAKRIFEKYSVATKEALNSEAELGVCRIEVFAKWIEGEKEWAWMLLHDSKKVPAIIGYSYSWLKATKDARRWVEQNFDDIGYISGVSVSFDEEKNREFAGIESRRATLKASMYEKLMFVLLGFLIICCFVIPISILGFGEGVIVGIMCCVFLVAIVRAIACLSSEYLWNRDKSP